MYEPAWHCEFDSLFSVHGDAGCSQLLCKGFSALAPWALNAFLSCPVFCSWEIICTWDLHLFSIWKKKRVHAAVALMASLSPLGYRQSGGWGGLSLPTSAGSSGRGERQPASNHCSQKVYSPVDFPIPMKQ